MSRRGGARRPRSERRRPLDLGRAAAAAVALACAAGLAVLVWMPLEPIAAVHVAGARHLSPAEVAGTTALVGVPLFHASASDARAALLAVSAVRDARVELALPGKATVTLFEREAVGRWVVGSVEWFVDGDGVLFASGDPTAAPALRVRDDRTPSRTAGERIDPALVGATLRLAKVAPGELRPDAREPAVRVRPGTDGVVLESGAGWEVRFGAPELIEEKLARALLFLRERPTRRLEYVDVRSLDHIVFSPE